jgi:UDP:flavonoid glycosyltransferase YjiC (YdhE family)
VTFGTVFNRETSLIGAIVGSLASMPVDIVVTTGPGVDRSLLAPPPANVQILDYVSLTEILPTCCAVVSHGGSGTMLAALGHGVPLLLVPQGADQFLNADAVVAADAGIAADAEDDLAGHLQRLLTEPRHRAAAWRVAAEIAAMPAAVEVAGDLMALGRSSSPNVDI